MWWWNTWVWNLAPPSNSPSTSTNSSELEEVVNPLPPSKRLSCHPNSHFWNQYSMHVISDILCTDSCSNFQLVPVSDLHVSFDLASFNEERSFCVAQSNFKAAWDIHLFCIFSTTWRFMWVLPIFKSLQTDFTMLHSACTFHIFYFINICTSIFQYLVFWVMWNPERKHFTHPNNWDIFY